MGNEQIDIKHSKTDKNIKKQSTDAPGKGLHATKQKCGAHIPTFIEDQLKILRKIQQLQQIGTTFH